MYDGKKLPVSNGQPYDCYYENDCYCLSHHTLVVKVLAPCRPTASEKLEALADDSEAGYNILLGIWPPVALPG